jgi:2-methylisocitrate lyase-like PEP mutase family enzyme
VVRAVSPKPVNVVVGPRKGLVCLAELSAAGVKRVSIGGALYRKTMTTLVELAEEMSKGNLPALEGGITYGEIGKLFPSA